MEIIKSNEIQHCSTCDKTINENTSYVMHNGTVFCAKCIYEVKKEEAQNLIKSISNRQENNLKLLELLTHILSQPENESIRLGQLLASAVPEGQDIFYVESDVLLKNISETYRQ